jgi:hypothetical protein
MEYLITVLLAVIGFFLSGLYNDLKAIKDLLSNMRVNEAVNAEKLKNHEERIAKLELEQQT